MVGPWFKFGFRSLSRSVKLPIFLSGWNMLHEDPRKTSLKKSAGVGQEGSCSREALEDMIGVAPSTLSAVFKQIWWKNFHWQVCLCDKSWLEIADTTHLYLIFLTVDYYIVHIHFRKWLQQTVFTMIMLSQGNTRKLEKRNLSFLVVVIDYADDMLASCGWV